MGVDSFLGSAEIILQPNDQRVSYLFTFTVNSSIGANDGFLPYDTNIVSATVNGYTIKGVSIPTLVDSIDITNNQITVYLNYPGSDGKYKITFILVLDNDVVSVVEADYTHIVVKNL